MIDDLTRQFQGNPDIGIAYLYCSFRLQDKQKADDLLASILKQLAQERPFLPKNVKDLYNKHKNKRKRPQFDEMLRALHSVVAMCSRVFIRRRTG